MAPPSQLDLDLSKCFKGEQQLMCVYPPSTSDSH